MARRRPFKGEVTTQPVPVVGFHLGESIVEKPGEVMFDAGENLQTRKMGVDDSLPDNMKKLVNFTLGKKDPKLERLESMPAIEMGDKKNKEGKKGELQKGRPEEDNPFWERIIAEVGLNEAARSIMNSINLAREGAGTYKRPWQYLGLKRVWQPEPLPPRYNLELANKTIKAVVERLTVGVKKDFLNTYYFSLVHFSDDVNNGLYWCVRGGSSGLFKRPWNNDAKGPDFLDYIQVMEDSDNKIVDRHPAGAISDTVKREMGFLKKLAPEQMLGAYLERFVSGEYDKIFKLLRIIKTLNAKFTGQPENRIFTGSDLELLNKVVWPLIKQEGTRNVEINKIISTLFGVGVYYREEKGFYFWDSWEE